MSYKLFLDDERVPSKVSWIDLPLGPWEIVRNYKDFVEIVRRKGLPSFISFDHDLADEHYKVNLNDTGSLKIPYTDYKEKTGLECAKFIVEYCMETGLRVPEFSVHSQNRIGKENIEKLLNGYQKFVDSNEK